jgi:hypothetical protein
MQLNGRIKGGVVVDIVPANNQVPVKTYKENTDLD